MRFRPARFVRATVLGLPVVAALAGCSTFSEQHFFKSIDSKRQAINYYRLRVSGATGLSSSRYLSGYFDEAAVDTYFNEIVQPANATVFPKRDDAATAAVPAPGAERIVPISGGDDGRVLVLILSSNADEIANQIGAFAENREMTATLGRLLNRDKIEASANAADSLADEKSRGQTIVALGAEMTTSITKEGVAKDTVAQNVLGFLNAFAREFGQTAPFKDLTEARKWLNDNRGRIAAGQE